MMDGKEIEYVKNIDGLEVRCILVNQLMRHIKKLYWEYEEKYHVRPNHLKIPEYLCLSLRRESGYSVVDVPEGYSEYLFGLKICPTTSIQTIEEIEVF